MTGSGVKEPDAVAAQFAASCLPERAAGYELERVRTITMTVFVLMSFFQAGSARTERRSLFTVSPFSNPFLIATAVGSLGLQRIAMTWPVSAGVLGLIEVEKFERRIMARRASAV